MKAIKSSWRDIAYMGDDLNDLGALSTRRFADGTSRMRRLEVKELAQFVSNRQWWIMVPLREAVEYILKSSRSCGIQS